MKSSHYVVALAALLVAGCDSTSNNLSRTTTGQVLGQSEWKTISPGESVLSFDNPPVPILRYQENKLPSRQQNFYSYSTGSSLYDRVFSENGGFQTPTDTSVETARSAASTETLKSRGIVFNTSAPVRGRVRAGPYAYFQGSGGGVECSAFQLFFDQSIAGLGNFFTAYLRGYYCGSAAQSREKVNADTVAFLGSIFYDGGALNRTRAVTTTQAVAPQTISRQPSAPQTQPQPSTPSSTAALQNTPAPGLLGVGARLRSANGGFQITSRNDRLVTTSNAAGQSARWFGGFFSPPRGSGDSYAGRVLELFPLAMERSIELRESGNNDDIWVHTIRVIRQEPLTVSNETFQVFVIEWRERASGPNQGQFERLRTIWFSPVLGFPLRYRTQNIAGAAVTETSWDVDSITRP